MAIRALIVAVENYPNIEALHRTLPDTHADGLAFRDWLIDAKPAPQDIYLCMDGPEASKTHGGTRAEVVRAIRDLLAHADETEELYVFFSGHGFTYDERGHRTADVFVCEEFTDRQVGGSACINLDELQRKLRAGLGYGSHYYFVDACRNMISDRDIEVVPMGLVVEGAATGSALVYTTFSTERGAAASTRSGFRQHLIDGLKGVGRAKIWRGSEMAVVYRSLYNHLERRMTETEIGGHGDAPEGLIFRLPSPPNFTCTVRVTNATPADHFDLDIKNSRNQSIGREQFVGPQHDLILPPDEYYLEMEHPSVDVEATDVPPADLYEDCQFEFMKLPSRSSGLAPHREFSQVSLDVLGVGDNEIVVTSLMDGSSDRAAGELRRWLPPGEHRIDVFDSNGYRIHTRNVDLTPGPGETIDLAVSQRTHLHQSILAQLPEHARHEFGVELSESIGYMSDDDTGLWISLLGASRILGPERFSKLQDFRMATFDQLGPDEAALYVVAGFNESVRLEVASNGDRVLLRPVPGLHGVSEARLDADPGPGLVSIRAGGGESLTLATHFLPNRATLVTLSQTDDKAAIDPRPLRGRPIAIHQFLLPVGHLVAHMHPMVQNRLGVGEEPLDAVRFITLAQRQFARYQPLEPTGPGVAPGTIRRRSGREHWEETLYGKWLDPLMAVIAAYELIRRGRRDHIEEVVRNLREYFEGLADTEAIAKLAGLQSHRPDHTPLLLEGVLAFDDQEEFLPYRASRLDYRRSWTLWNDVHEW